MFRISSSDKRPDRTQDPRDRALSRSLLSQTPGQLGSVSSLDWVHSELHLTGNHWINTFPMHTLLPTTSLPLDRTAIGSPRCGLLVPLEGNGLGTCPSPKGSSEAQNQTDGYHHTTKQQYQPGDLVWLSFQDIRLWLPCKKLSPHYIVTFTIIRQINKVTPRPLPYLTLLSYFSAKSVH